MSVRLDAKKSDSKFVSKGVVDGGHHSFECSSCNAPLADIWVTRPDVDIKWNIVAECCHCGDRSYQKVVQGAFQIGSNEKSERYTVVENVDYDKDPMVIQTKQVKPYVI